MSGLEALSMVCSIMQVISFTKEVLTVCKDVYEGRSTADSQMEENATSIKALLDEMNRSAGSVRQRTKEEKELFAIAQKCSKAAEELQKEIRQVTKYQKPGDYKRAAIAGYKFIFGKRKITGLYDQFCKYQKTLETHILVRLCTKTDAIELQRRENFTQLSDTMKHFISQMAAGHTDMAHLITRDGTQTREQIQQSEDRVRQEINDVQTEAVNEAKRERLLGSLKYDAMNARRTGLTSAHEATYTLIYDSLDTASIDTDSLDTEGPEVKVATAWKGFITWLKSEKKVFWIQGKPGSGKSTLLKFILQHEKTQIVLERWRPNTLAVSHFFWKPGNPLQKNLRGLLCSLNHQLLSGDHTLVGHVLSEFPFAGGQDTVGDWEITQLKSVFYSVLKQCNRSVFLLIDGLDEATETEKILQWLDSLIGLHNVKLCISSRSEDVFRRKFSRYDGFKLEDLTRDDMMKYARAELPPSNERYPSEYLENLRDLLVDKAEGVFLWLVLALESVKRGLRNNDGQDKIHSRLKQLPSELEDLYAEMWDRLGEDKAIYQQEAARYFSLLITHNALLEEFVQSVSFSFEFHMTPFILMLDGNESLRGKMLNASHQPSVPDIDKECADVALGIPIKTAGLLVNRYIGVVRKMGVRLEYAQLEKHLSSGVEFLHRTLLDFFVQSEAGRTIIAQSQTSCIQLELATLILCQLRTLEYGNRLTQYLTCVGGPLHYCVWILGRFLAQDSSSPSVMVMDLLSHLESLFAAGLVSWDDRPDWYPPPSFDILLFIDPAFKGVLQSRMQSRGASHATVLLREVMRGYSLKDEYSFSNIWKHLDLEECLSTLGVDINSIDICLFNACFQYWWRSELYAPYESILSAAIKICISALFRGDVTGEHMRMLLAALKRAPDLYKRTSVYWTTIYESAGGKDHYVFKYLPFDSLMRSGDPDGEPEVGLFIKTGVTVISEVNLRYLIENIFKAIPSSWKNEMPEAIRAQHLLEAESSKPHIRPRFLIEKGFPTERERRYRFLDQDIDILAENTITEAADDQPARYAITDERLEDYLNRCESFRGSVLSVLADERLGICRPADMGIKPPTCWN